MRSAVPPRLVGIVSSYAASGARKPSRLLWWELECIGEIEGHTDIGDRRIDCIFQGIRIEKDQLSDRQSAAGPSGRPTSLFNIESKAPATQIFD